MSSRLVLRVGTVLASAIALVGEVGVAQTTTRVSVDSAGQQATGGHSELPSISADGNFVAFESYAPTLVPGDTNGAFDIFVRNRLGGTTECVSVNSAGVIGDSGSYWPSISADGRFVAYSSGASNLVAGDTNGVLDIFVHDRVSGVTERVSVGTGGAQASDLSDNPSLSADGRFVAFESWASNLVAGDTNGSRDVFVRDRQTGSTRRMSVDSSGGQGNSSSYRPAISADGRLVAFDSFSSNLVPGDINGSHDIFLRDRLLGTTERVSVDSGGQPGNAGSYYPAISADGRFVAFTSDATDLVASDTNGCQDVFVHDRQFGTTERVSVDFAGTQATSYSSNSALSADGHLVAFWSLASNLVAGDTNGHEDVFVHDLQSGNTERVSTATGGTQADSDSQAPSISADGRFVGFRSAATNLVPGDTNSSDDVFLHDRSCSGISTYCTPKTNSLGCIPSIGSLGLPSQSGSDNFYVTASNVLNNKLGMMLWATAPASNPFGGGTLCLHSPIVRTPAQMSGGSPTGSDCTGSYAYHFTQGYMIQQLLGANTTIYAQWWSRDPGFAVPNNIGLTNGLSFTICP